MFRRRIPLSWPRRVLLILWPAGGWRRALHYLRYRLIRLPGTPYGIAAGFASGAAVSFTPFLGLHFILGALLAFILRGNLLASAAGTAVGNPWSFPFIWAWIYGLGHWILGDALHAELPRSFDWRALMENPLELLWPMTVGGIPTAVAMWFLFFLPVRRIVSDYQKARRRRLRRKIRRKRIKSAKLRAEAAVPESGTKMQGPSAPCADATARQEEDPAAPEGRFGKCAAMSGQCSSVGPRSGKVLEDGADGPSNPDPVPYPRIVGGRDHNTE